MDLLTCPYCGKDDIKNGASVCGDCQATIIYGATIQELNNAALLSGLVAGIIPVLIGIIQFTHKDLSFIGWFLAAAGIFWSYKHGFFKPFSYFLKNIDPNKVTFYR